MHNIYALNNCNIYWIGTRESDIHDIKTLYKKSITIFGSNQNNNISFSAINKRRVNHNLQNKEIEDFFHDKLKEITNYDKHAKFMFYNPSYAYKFEQEIINKTICLNELSILGFLSNKVQSRLVISNYVPTLRSKVFLGNQCTIQNIKSFFPDSKTFVIQSNFSSGGIGTHILDEESEKIIKNRINYNEPYLVSPYIKNSIPVNTHIIVFKNQVLLLPSSIQILCCDDNRLLYKGADFISYSELSSKLISQIEKCALNISEILRKSGYLGVCGVDFLIEGENVYFVEINNRFQASTALLNCGLADNNLPSVNELNLEAFFNNDFDKRIEVKHAVNYSCYTYSYEKNELSHYNYILGLVPNEPTIVRADLDGYDQSHTLDNGSYLFRIIFRTNISSIYKDGFVNIHDNIVGINQKVSQCDLFEIKTRLKNQGIYLTNKARKYLRKKGNAREAVFNAIDFTINDDIYINSPIDIKFSKLSPYNIDYDNNSGLFLKCYEDFLFPVKIDLADKYANYHTNSGIPFSKISKLATDRLRIHHQSNCNFKIQGAACKFCDLTMDNEPYTLNDICEVIDFYLNKNNFRHFLIGGGSAKLDSGWENIIEIASYIRKRSNKQIYLMTLPTDNENILRDIFKAGVNEIAFNIEIFDREIARKIMPQKGSIPIEKYYAAFEISVKLWGNKGNVRSLVILGLESSKSLLSGVEKLCSIGVCPILSIFRPLPNTPLEEYIPPSYTYIGQLFWEIYHICNQYGLLPGPSCKKCQNNTVVL